MVDRNAIEEEAARRYVEDPSLLDPAGPPERLPPGRRRLGGAVPIRFTPEMIERIKAVAECESMSVSSWIRSEVQRALDRREDGAVDGLAPVIRLTPSVDPHVMLEGLERAVSHGGE